MIERTKIEDNKNIREQLEKQAISTTLTFLNKPNQQKEKTSLKNGGSEDSYQPNISKKFEEIASEAISKIKELEAQTGMPFAKIVAEVDKLRKMDLRKKIVKLEVAKEYAIIRENNKEIVEHYAGLKAMYENLVEINSNKSKMSKQEIATILREHINFIKASTNQESRAVTNIVKIDLSTPMSFNQSTRGHLENRGFKSFILNVTERPELELLERYLGKFISILYYLLQSDIDFTGIENPTIQNFITIAEEHLNKYL